MKHPGKDKKQSKSDRLDRALARATDTGSSHYGLDEKDIEFCTKQIKQSKSSFVMRWGRLGIHRVLCGAGVCFVAYDSSIKSISFFIPKQRGHEIAKGSRSAAWGKKRSGILLLPPLRKKAPLRAGQISLPIEDDYDDDDIPLSVDTIRKMKAGLKRRIRNFQDRIDAHMEDDPAANWPAIASLGAQVENLEQQLSELPSPAETTVEIEVLDEAYRRAVISELLTTQSSLELCSEHTLSKRARDLASLKDALFSLTPDPGDQTNREAMHNAAVQLASQIDHFQETRSWLPGTHRLDDSHTSKAMRARLRALYTVYTTVFGSGTFGSQDTITIIGDPPDVANPPGDDEAEAEVGSPAVGPLSGWPAVAARCQFLVNEIRELNKKVTGAGTQADADHHYQCLLYKRELGALPGYGECVSLSDEEIDRMTLQYRIGSLETFIDWYSTGAGMGSVGYTKRLARYAEHLERMLSVWDSRYAQKKGEHGDVAESQQVSGG